MFESFDGTGNPENTTGCDDLIVVLKVDLTDGVSKHGNKERA